MNKIFVKLMFLLLPVFAGAQRIVSIEHNGKKYEVLDMTQTGKITWGGYDEIGDAVRSEDDGAANTQAIVKFVGANKGFDGKAYAAKVCDTSRYAGKTDWYLPSKSEVDAVFDNITKFGFEERISLWTSTEANGTQAVSKYLYSGAFYNVQKVDEYHFVCIRKVN
ncbi:hypothetical protein [Lacibacter sp. H407]|uniref:hypothetical protein n=1 Tax=Lacibacter sp. H407 TaxID=3133423 RepID=UPI0030BD06D6